MLHNNKELFEQAILRTSDTFGIEASIVEKDYFVTLFLKELSKILPGIIFKGGTSLSKCHKIIKRFSEDIDLNIEYETKSSQGQRKGLKEDVVTTIQVLGLELENADEIKSNREYNKYIVDFPSVFKFEALKPHLIVETMLSIRAYPTEKMPASSFIYDYFVQNGFDDLINEYDLAPFELNIQTAERTFIDKVYALGDYYLAGKVQEHSRHLYDLYKLLDIVKLDDNLKALVKSVREDRKNNKTGITVLNNVDMYALLDEIIAKDIYKDDYIDRTGKLLFEAISYDEVISALKTIRDSRIF